MSTISSQEATKEVFKSGFVTLIGRPSAGKSSLLNALMGKKLAISSPTAQTTRHRFRAVHTTDSVSYTHLDVYKRQCKGLRHAEIP